MPTEQWKYNESHETPDPVDMVWDVYEQIIQATSQVLQSVDGDDSEVSTMPQ